MPVDTTAKPKPPAPARRAPAKPVITPIADPADSREKGLLGYAQLASLGAVMRGWYADAGAIGTHAPGICKEVAALAAQNESVAKTVDYLVAAGPYTALIATVLPLVMQIGVNHGRIPADAAGMGGILPPDVLEARVKADIELMRLKAAQEADKARQEIEELRTNIATGGVNGDHATA